MSKEMVKQNINLLEYPLWFQDECEAAKCENGFVWKHPKGFVIRTGFKPPVKTDVVFLFYLMLQSQNQDWKDEFFITRYQILKGCGLTTDAQTYDRLEESLKRWEQVNIEFNNAFYNGQEYKTLHFGVIDSWGIHEETKKLRIRFSPEYLSMIKDTSYCKYINFDQIKALRSPLATRLYQLLIKTFKDRDIWKIDAVRLAEKIPMKKKFPAQIVLEMRPAVNRIYKHTDLKVTVKEEKQARGKIILVFQKEHAEPKEKPLEKKTPPFIMPDSEDFKKLVSILPLERQHQKSLLELVLKAFNEKGFDFVAWNIRYANKRAIGNYPAYFLKSIQGNFGAIMKEEEEVGQLAASKRIEEKKTRQIKLTKAQEKEDQESVRIQEYIKCLTTEERNIIDQEAFAKLPTFLKKKQSFEEIRKGNHISFRGLVCLVAQEKLRAREASQLALQQLKISEDAE